MEKLPTPTSLREAVSEVIKNNRKQGYNPTRFVNMVNTNDQELLNVCHRLVISKDALSALYEAILKYPKLLTIEDLIAAYGDQWGFDGDTIEEAKVRSKMLDEAVKRQRFYYE